MKSAQRIQLAVKNCISSFCVKNFLLPNYKEISLKNAFCIKSAQRIQIAVENWVSLHFTDATLIAKTPMRLLSHVKTKSELTQYLARKVLKKSQESGKNVVVAWGDSCSFKQFHRKVQSDPKFREFRFTSSCE